MGASNTIQRFWEIHHDGRAVSVVIWYGRPKNRGYYCGYVGWTDPSREFPHDLEFHYGESVGGMNTSEIPEIGISVRVTGFDTIHGTDINIGPNRELGASSRTLGFCEDTIWTKEKVFQRLREITDDALDRELEPLF